MSSQEDLPGRWSGTALQLVVEYYLSLTGSFLCATAPDRCACTMHRGIVGFLALQKMHALCSNRAILATAGTSAELHCSYSNPPHRAGTDLRAFGIQCSLLVDLVVRSSIRNSATTLHSRHARSTYCSTTDKPPLQASFLFSTSPRICSKPCPGDARSEGIRATR